MRHYAAAFDSQVLLDYAASLSASVAGCCLPPPAHHAAAFDSHVLLDYAAPH